MYLGLHTHSIYVYIVRTTSIQILVGAFKAAQAFKISVPTMISLPHFLRTPDAVDPRTDMGEGRAVSARCDQPAPHGQG